MACAYIKPEVKKMRQQQCTAIHKACIGWWDENLLFDGEGMTLLIVEDEHLFVDFSGGEN